MADQPAPTAGTSEHHNQPAAAVGDDPGAQEAGAGDGAMATDQDSPGHVPMAERLPLPDWGNGSMPSEPSVDNEDQSMVCLGSLSHRQNGTGTRR
jgi:hypothetical protein